MDLTEPQRLWREEVRGFLARHVTDALREELAPHVRGHGGHGPEIERFRRLLKELGWWGLTLPVEYGGLGRSAVEQMILIEELRYEGVPGPDLTVTSVAPMIVRHGTERNKQDWLPGIAGGEIKTAVGYSEPDAGTDLAGLRTTARLDGDEWVINGSKIWNSFAEEATHEWLCVRTSTEDRRQDGISVLIVPVDTPGIEIRPIITWAESRTNELFLTDVRVPAGNLIGEAGKAWEYITGALYLERAAVATYGDLRRAFDLVVEAYRATPVEDLVVDQEIVLDQLGALDAEIEVARLYAYELAALIDAGAEPVVEATAAKILTTELQQRIADVGTQLLGMHGQLDHRDPRAPERGALERLYREAPLMRFGGGTNEVMRDVIAQLGHRMPSYRSRTR